MSIVFADSFEAYAASVTHDLQSAYTLTGASVVKKHDAKGDLSFIYPSSSYLARDFAPRKKIRFSSEFKYSGSSSAAIVFAGSAENAERRITGKSIRLGISNNYFTFKYASGSRANTFTGPLVRPPGVSTVTKYVELEVDHDVSKNEGRVRLYVNASLVMDETYALDKIGSTKVDPLEDFGYAGISGRVEHNHFVVWDDAKTDGLHEFPTESGLKFENAAVDASFSGKPLTDSTSYTIQRDQPGGDEFPFKDFASSGRVYASFLSYRAASRAGTTPSELEVVLKIPGKSDITDARLIAPDAPFERVDIQLPSNVTVAELNASTVKIGRPA